MKRLPGAFVPEAYTIPNLFYKHLAGMSRTKITKIVKTALFLREISRVPARTIA